MSGLPFYPITRSLCLFYRRWFRNCSHAWHCSTYIHTLSYQANHHFLIRYTRRVKPTLLSTTTSSTLTPNPHRRSTLRSVRLHHCLLRVTAA